MEEKNHGAMTMKQRLIRFHCHALQDHREAAHCRPGCMRNAYFSHSRPSHQCSGLTSCDPYNVKRAHAKHTLHSQKAYTIVRVGP